MKLVEVTGHALRRARVRRHYAADELTDNELADCIVAEVRAAFAGGRCSIVRPRWAVRWREVPLPLGPDRVVVWDEAEDHCWIVERLDVRDVVVTSMHRVVARAAAA